MATTEASLPGADVRTRSEAATFRRGLVMVLMSVVVPGSAQVAGGSGRIGRWGLRVWFAIVAAVVVAGFLAVVARNVLLGIVATGWVLWIVSWVVLALGLFWSFLLLNAWWASRPRDMGRVRGGMLGAVALLLAGTVAYGSVVASTTLRASANLLGTVLGGGGDTKQKAGRYNILLLGSDAGNDREGVRTDSVTVVSVDAKTGRSVMFGLPRNLEDVPFPESSPLHALYPKGYGCESHECMLNAIYTLGQNNKKLYPGVKDPGIQAVKEAVAATTGLEINYYAMIDMYGFAELIDALGGIHLDIGIPVPVGGDQLKTTTYIEPGKDRLLNGAEALWFARQRTGSTDYARMQRQKCVMSAMLHQMDPLTVAAKFTSLADATGKIVVTDVPPSEVGTMASLATKARALDIANVSFAPPLIAPGSPNYDLIRSTIASEIAKSEALDSAKPATATTTAAAATTQPTAKATSQSSTVKISKFPSASMEETVTTQTEDLAAVCAVS